MKKILIIDNNIDPPYGCAEIREQLARAGIEGYELVSLRGPDSALPASPAGFSGVVISGSKTRIFENAPWIDKEIDFLKQLHREQIPTLGICYGEQLMVRVFSAEKHTGASTKPEYGWAEIELTAEAKKSKLFKDLPAKFHSFEFHSDEAYEIGSNFRLIAKSAWCPVQAFDMLDAPMWGVQFHPERGVEEGTKSLERKKKADPSLQLLGIEDGPKVFSAGVADSIFSNFLKEVRASGK